MYVSELVILLLLPFALSNTITGLGLLLILGVYVYLHNSPIQIHYLSVAEKDYPQANVMASSLNSIFSNFGIALGSTVGGPIVDHWGLAATGFGGAAFILLTGVIVVELNRVNRAKQK
ncbi:hypothetical protein L248_0744 [Schleiferilactobacillus shenzhenensis LY-73]|uniref:Major facilitator superfamily (MFS) profile domain-containing protein n=1 Tax=Schleiferilactobacillus shenzhenensis LY-73 TaxID=1231336 RepID=U4TTA0_9LACO|nr:hypothetical protein L248_0744 [Schleiferilactobacillus shenzhenensis LY-73]